MAAPKPNEGAAPKAGADPAVPKPNAGLAPKAGADGFPAVPKPPKAGADPAVPPLEPALNAGAEPLALKLKGGAPEPGAAADEAASPIYSTRACKEGQGTEKQRTTWEVLFLLLSSQ